MGFFDPFCEAVDVNELKSDLSSLKSDIESHTNNNDIHVTASDKSNWNNKLDKNQGTENSGKVLGTNANGEVIPLNGYGFEYDEETKMLKYGTDPTSNLNQGIGLDDTLSKRGYAADAGAVGELKEDLNKFTNLNPVEYETGKVVSVDNLKPNKIKIEFVDIINGGLAQCYVSTDGLGSNGMIAPTNEFGKLQTVSQIIVHYSEISFASPSVRIDHDHETELKFTVQNLQPGETVIQQQNMKDVFKIEVDENGLYYTITSLDKCYEIVYIHDTNHREIVDGSGVIKNLSVNDEVVVYINMKDTCKPDVKPELTPEKPETPEKPKLPEFLPDTGFELVAYGVVGLGLAGLGIAINKKRK